MGAPKYAGEFKKDAVALLESSGESVAAVARRLGTDRVLRVEHGALEVDEVRRGWCVGHGGSVRIGHYYSSWDTPS